MTNTKLHNPFMPSFGRIPPMVLDQQVTMNKYLLHLDLKDAKYQTSLVLGVRGSGKTVFLLNVQRNYEKKKKHYFIRLNLGQGNLLFQLLSSLHDKFDFDWHEIIGSIQAINVLGNGITFKENQINSSINYAVALQKILIKL